eukprot:scaffold40252_cov28-Tisochrysis_lutea.AAC.2
MDRRRCPRTSPAAQSRDVTDIRSRGEQGSCAARRCARLGRRAVRLMGRRWHMFWRTTRACIGAPTTCRRRYRGESARGRRRRGR